MLLLTLCGSAFGQEVGKPSKAIFYEVSSPRAKIYLLGSIHVAPQSMYPLPKEIEDAFAASQVLNVEVDLRKDGGTLDTPANQQAAAQKLFASPDVLYPAGDDLWKHLDKETAGKVRDWCKKAGAPDDIVATMRPWLVCIALMGSEFASLGLDTTSGIDEHFLKESTNSPKTVEQIETFDSQLKLFESMPEADQIANLKENLNEVDNARAILQKMFDGWLSGDEKEVGSDDSLAADPATDKAFLTDRNLVMANFVEKELKSGTRAFVVVGAAHMVGDDGIVALLRKRGYTVTRPDVNWTHRVPLSAKQGR